MIYCICPLAYRLLLSSPLLLRSYYLNGSVRNEEFSKKLFYAIERQQTSAMFLVKNDQNYSVKLVKRSHLFDHLVQQSLTRSVSTLCQKVDLSNGKKML